MPKQRSSNSKNNMVKVLAVFSWVQFSYTVRSNPGLVCIDANFQTASKKNIACWDSKLRGRLCNISKPENKVKERVQTTVIELFAVCMITLSR